MIKNLTHSSAMVGALLLLLRPGIAQAQTYVDLPGTQPNELRDGTPLDSSSGCGVTCHYSRDPETPSIMPYDGWAGSMMGGAMRDPLFLAALTVAEQDRPGVGDYCLRCHTPPGFLAGRTRSSRTASRGTDLDVADLEGITCDSCHRMLPTPNVRNAQFVISPTDTRYGPHGMVASIRHPSAVSTWLPDSRMCGTCHNITNPAQPLRRANGTDTGQRFPLDTTYSEWVQSDFARAGSPDARSCQDCHMPRAPMPGFTASTSGAIRRDAPRQHTFIGANVWGLQVLASLRNDIRSGPFYDPDQAALFTQGARLAEQSLRSAVTLEIRQAPTTAAAGSRVEVVARITNRTGHRVPTGYADSRRVWLEVALVDASNAETVISGDYDMAEAHLEEMDPQLKLYETLHARIGIGVEEHIALHDTIAKDTRLPPRGYRPLPGHEPVGADYSGGANGALRHWDDARYMITVPPTARGALRVRVRARYQTTTRHYVEFLANENRTDDRGRELLRIYNATGRAAPINMAEATTTIMVTGGATPDGGVRDGGAQDGSDAPIAVTASGGCQLSVGGRASRTGGLWAAAAFALALAARRTRRRA